VTGVKAVDFWQLQPGNHRWEAANREYRESPRFGDRFIHRPGALAKACHHPSVELRSAASGQENANESLAQQMMLEGVINQAEASVAGITTPSEWLKENCSRAESSERSMLKSARRSRVRRHCGRQSPVGEEHGGRRAKLTAQA
jgi:hypothetical protein